MKAEGSFFPECLVIVYCTSHKHIKLLLILTKWNERLNPNAAPEDYLACA
jgi:hypothetical protein